MNQYSLQSPFLYDFYSSTIQSNVSAPDQPAIEHLRNQMASSDKVIQTSSYGVQSKISNSASRSLSNIANGGITLEKYSSLLYRIIAKMDSKNIIELGTSLGINTLYLSSNPEVHVTTFEGSHDTLKVAKENFEKLARKNITCIEGNIDHTLPEFLSSQDRIDMVFFDANHQKASTLDYFEQSLRKTHEKSVFIFDDIHWSPEMTAAWKQIQSNQVVSVTLDLFQVGIVFFDHHLAKENFILSY